MPKRAPKSSNRSPTARGSQDRSKKSVRQIIHLGNDLGAGLPSANDVCFPNIEQCSTRSSRAKKAVCVSCSRPFHNICVFGRKTPPPIFICACCQNAKEVCFGDARCEFFSLDVQLPERGHAMFFLVTCSRSLCSRYFHNQCVRVEQKREGITSKEWTCCGSEAPSSPSSSSPSAASGPLCFAECSRRNNSRLATIQCLSMDCRAGDFHRVCFYGKKQPSGILICLDRQTRLRYQSKLCFPRCVFRIL